MSDKEEFKTFPPLTSDLEAEHFVETADLSDYDFSDMAQVRYEFSAKDSRVNMRLPTDLLEAVKALAIREGLPYQRLIRQTLETAVNRARRGPI